jgi:CRISPR-associated protein Cas1
MKSSPIEAKEDLAILYAAEKKSDAAMTIEELMGYEGIAAKSYFRVLSQLVVPTFRFNGRNRRPPKDPFNAMLSLGYSILLNNVYGAIETRGLNPYFGFFHRDREKHPTLASDLMEEWRAIIVDSTVMSLVNGYEIARTNFNKAKDGPGIFIDKPGMKIFLNKLERKFMADNKYLPYIDYAVSFRRAIDMQVVELSKAIDETDPTLYSPIIIR